jgi:long-chain acyl-CoA synthetase
MIKEFLKGKTFLITGATGFLGQPLVEKILWSVPEVRRIYVLIRPKRQFGGRLLSAQDRLERELWDSTVFERLQARLGEGLLDFLREKIHAVAGDISQEDLRLSAEDRNRLETEVDIIINSAAVVSFDAPLNEALELNVHGAERVAKFAAGCRHAILVHVSTAYVCGAARGEIPETLHHTAQPGTAEQFPVRAFTDVEADIRRIEEIIQAVETQASAAEVRRSFAEEYLKRLRSKRSRRPVGRRQEIEVLRRRWISARLAEEGMKWARQRGWNDTYTYTKALGEQLVARYADRIPMAIVRPSVIESSLSEPVPGWLDGLRMADPLIVAIGKGRLRSLPLNPKVSLDLVPADMVVNAILALLPAVQQKGCPQIIQVATGARNPITLGELNQLIYRYFSANPMLDRDGRPIQVRPLRFPAPATFRLQHRLRSVPLTTAERTLERLPLIGQKAKRKVSATRAANEKLYYYGEIYEPYLNLNCSFLVDRTLELYTQLSPEEQQEFNFDVTQLNWRHYIQNVHIPGVKKYILKMEGSGTLELSPVEPELEFPSTIGELVRRSAQRWPQHPALQIKRRDKWVRFTYREVDEQSLQVAENLFRAGLRPGDRVVFFSENQPEWGICYLGANALGLVVVPLDAQTWHREVWSVAAFTKARAILASTRCFQRLPAAGLEENERQPEPVLFLSLEQLGRPFELRQYPRSTAPAPRQEEFTLPEQRPEDPVSIIFTTGTAVDPKGAVHTHRSFLSNLQGVHRYLSISEEDRLVSLLPLYHALEFTCGFLMAMYRGATVTYAQSLKPRLILETIRETRATCMLGVPTLFALLREDLERRVLKAGKSGFKTNMLKTSRELSRSLEQTFGRNLGKRLFVRVHKEFGGHIRFFVSGGSALGRSLYRDFRAMGMPIYEGYGLTETAPVLTVNPLHRSREGSAGKPLPGVEMRLYRPDRDGIGEIIVRTPSIMTEYFRNPEATRKALRDGWFHTGDLGWVDADGYVYITGRCKDVIVTGAGKNVYPTDLEAIYRSLPAVADIGVVGVKSGLTEDVKAVVVPAPSLVEGGDLEAARRRVLQEIQELARELPSYHRLQSVQLHAGPLPRRPDGSLDREAILDLVSDERQVRRPRIEKLAREAGRRETLFRELSRLSGIEVDQIHDESNLYTDLGLDSLMAVELLLFMERELGLAIPDDRVAAFQTVGDVLNELRKGGLGEPPEGMRPRFPQVRSALPFDARPLMDRAVMTTSFSLIRTLFCRYFKLKVENQSVLPKEGAYIIAANHSSHLDSAAVISALSLAMGIRRAQRMHVIGARDYFFNSRFRSWLFSTCLNVVPIERDEIGLSGLRMVGSILRQGEPVLIFPEGTRSRTGRLQEFKPGVGLIAWEYQVPVVPAYIEGAFAAMPAGKSVPSRVPIRVSFADPLSMEDYRQAAAELNRDELYRRIAADLRQAIVSLTVK